MEEKQDKKSRTIRMPTWLKRRKKLHFKTCNKKNDKSAPGKKI